MRIGQFKQYTRLKCSSQERVQLETTLWNRSYKLGVKAYLWETLTSGFPIRNRIAQAKPMK